MVKGSDIGLSDELYQVVLILVYSLIDSMPASLPYPLSFIPPNGAIGDINRYVLINTIPALIAFETLSPLAKLEV